MQPILERRGGVRLPMALCGKLSVGRGDVVAAEKKRNSTTAEPHSKVLDTDSVCGVFAPTIVPPSLFLLPLSLVGFSFHSPAFGASCRRSQSSCLCLRNARGAWITCKCPFTHEK